MKQHYVPKVYLKHFTNDDEHFFATQPRSKYIGRPRRFHPSQVCYVKNFYDYEEFSDIEDRRFIEINAFPYEEEVVNVLMTLFKGNPAFIRLSHYRGLVELILNLKLRNLSIREFYRNTDVDEYLEDAGNKLKADLPFIEFLLGMPFSQYLERLKTKIELQSDHGNTSHKDAIVRNLFDQIEPMNEVKKLLHRVEPIICSPKYQSDYFLTSDNPGFTVKDGVKVYNTSYKDFDSVGFPLNSKQLLILNIRRQTNPLIIKRRVHYVKCDSRDMELLNQGTTFNSIKHIFCQDSSYLEEFTSVFRKKFINYQKNN